MKKKILTSIATFCLLMGITVTALASQNFDFTIRPPFIGSMVSSNLVTVTTGMSPFVNPNVSATPTTYFLSPQRVSSTQATQLISNVSTAGRRNFTYLTGYGGVGNRYCLSAYPSNTSFLEYRVTGTWSP
jgi:hypothetical protein